MYNSPNNLIKLALIRQFILLLCIISSVNLIAQSPKEYYQKAEVNYKNADFKSCILFLEKSKNTLGHTNPRIESLLTSAYYYNGDIVKAKISYDRLLKIAPLHLKQSPVFAEYEALGQLIDSELQREEKKFHKDKQKEREKAMEQYLKPLALEEAPNLFEVTDCTNSNCSYGKTEEIKYEDCRKCNGSGKGPAIRIEGKYGPTYVRDDCNSCKGVGARNYAYRHTCTTCKGESQLFTYTGDYPFSDREIRDIVRNNKSNIIANSKARKLEKEYRSHCTSGDCKNGRGTYKSDNGDFYIGSFVNEKKQGKGKMLYVNKNIYNGEWKDDIINGQGKVTYASGNIYEGQFVNGSRNGQGKMIYANGDVYIGEWKGGKYNGHGKMTYSNGHAYEGEWKNDAKEGRGTYTWPSGQVYVGEWKMSQRNGFGKITYSNGEIYEGEWKDGESIKDLANTDLQTNNKNETERFDIIETQAEFKGGMAAFGNWLSLNLIYPNEARRLGVEGKVYVQFTVMEDGSITSIKIVKGIGAGCDEEVIRLLELCPKWIPATQRGKPLKQNMVIPIGFKLS